MGRASEARKKARNNIKKAQNKKKPDTKKKKDTNTDTKKKTLREKLQGVHEKLKPTLEKAGDVAETGVFRDLSGMSKGVSTGDGGPIGQGAAPEDDVIVSRYNAEYLKASKDIEKMYPI